MTTRKYFVILQQEELELDLTPAEQMVYLSIKSYCSNGKREFPLSTRDIASRTSLSQSYVVEIVPKLIKAGLVEIVGSEPHRGGKIPVYKVITSTVSSKGQVIDKVISSSKESDSQSEETDIHTKQSDNSSGSIIDKVKKEIRKNYLAADKDVDPQKIDWSPLEQISKVSDNLQSLAELNKKKWS